jgi:DNA-directed RNA polymerase sigma subunit (sigma70/sigma32)
MYRLEKAIASAMNEGSHMPTPQELADELGVSLKEVQTLIQANSDNFSLNAELDDESHTELADVIEQTTIPSAEDEMQEQSRREELLAHISELSPKERLVLTLRHGISDNMPKSLDELAEFLSRPAEIVAAVVEAARGKVCAALAIDDSELAQLLLYTNPNPKAWWRYWYELGDRPAGMSPDIDTSRVPLLESLTQQGLVQKTVDSLPLEEKTLLKLRYGVLQDDELTLRDIGEILGLSRERVRQIESRAEAKCRRSVRRDR